VTSGNQRVAARRLISLNRLTLFELGKAFEMLPAMNAKEIVRTRLRRVKSSRSLDLLRWPFLRAISRIVRLGGLGSSRRRGWKFGLGHVQRLLLESDLHNFKGILRRVSGTQGTGKKSTTRYGPEARLS
jgi:hypothetical protein